MHNREFRLLVATLLVFLGGLLLSATLAWQVQRHDQRQKTAHLTSLATLLTQEVEDRFAGYQYGLRGLRGAVLMTGDHLGREHIAGYLLNQGLAHDFPGAQGFGFIQRVPAGHAQAFVKQIRARDWPDFRIQQGAAQDGERDVILYAEPIGPNRQAIGLDIGVDPVARAAAQAALDLGQIQMSGPISFLAQTADKARQSVLVFLPIYAGGGVPSSRAERRRLAIGWSFAPLRVEQALADMEIDSAAMRVQISDITGPFPRLLFDSGISPDLTRYHQQRDFTIFGRRWRLQMTARPALFQPLQLQSPMLTFLTGGVLSVLLSGLLLAIGRNRLRWQQQQGEKRHLQALIRARDQLLLVAEVAELGVWSWQPASNKLEWNDRMFDLYAQPKSLRDGGLGYQHWLERIHPDDRACVDAELAAALAGTASFEMVFRVLRPNGSVRYVHGIAQIEHDPQGRPHQVTGINRDITAQHQLEAHLRDAKEQAEAMSETKSAFLANMSHEIRTPMNAVLGMLALLAQTVQSVRQQDYVNKAKEAATSLLSILNDILDYSKIEADKLLLDLHPFHLDDLLDKLATVLAGNKGQMNVEVVFDLDDGIPASLLGDSLRLQQVLINLAGNALKFTPQGLVQVQIQLHAIQPDAGAVYLRFAVRDTGIGIDLAGRERIFESFSQAEVSTTRRFGGSGLGLAISRRLVAMMGGSLELDSELGRGSCFWFDLRLPVVQGDSARHALATPAWRVLLVEDKPRVAESFLAMMSGFGWQTGFAAVGQAALQQLYDAVAAGQPYDLVLINWQLAAEDGLAISRQITRTCVNKPPRIILLAHSDGLHLAQLQGEAAVPDVLIKPVSRQQLLHGVLRVMSCDREVAAIPTSGPLRLAGLHVLVVEDNALNRQIADELLRAEGASVQLAEGGEAGIDAVRGTARPFDAVLMDLQMPDMDGLEACRRLRADSRFASLPIIAMTANVSPADRQACLEAGMNDHVGKPIDMPQLIAVLQQQTGPQPGDALPVVDRVKPVDSNLIESLDDLRLRFGGDLTLLRKLMPQLGEGLGAELAQLQDRVVADDITGATRCLHSIKGSAGSMGARALSLRAAELEAILKTRSGLVLVELLSPREMRLLAGLLKDCEQALMVALLVP